MKPASMMTQNMINPLGLECKMPCFSYLLPIENRGDKQTAYQILAASGKTLLEEGKADLWNSGKVLSEQNYGLVYEGSPLSSRQEVFWKVRVWDGQDQVSSWSECACFEMGLLKEEDWKAFWIGQGDDFDGDKSAAPAFVGSFVLQKKERVRKARLYISGLGLFAASINGEPVSDNLYEPGESPVTFQNWYGGEDYDGRKAALMKGWDTPEAEPVNWKQARRMAPPMGKLSAKEFLPIRIWERWKAESVKPLPNGNYLVDMGKNSAGFVCLKLWDTRNYGGKKIELYPAEVLMPDGSGVDQASCTQSCDRLWQCSVKDCYTIAGVGEEEWHPSFCYHGFHYIEIVGFPGIPTVDNFEGCAVRLMNEKYSDFETDNEILNQINQITDRSIESNMMCSFTDCPQIEKLGWLETTQLMFSSIASGYDIRSWIQKIVKDMRDAQVTPELITAKPMEADSQKYPGFSFRKFHNRETEEAGFVPGIAPEYHRIGGLYKDPNWGGACVMTPWYYYQEYGDIRILQDNFEVMKAYVEHLYRQSARGVLKDYAQMGEWGQLNENTPTTLVATCAFYLISETLSKIAGILGLAEEQDHYQKIAREIQEGFYQEKDCWQKESGTFGNGSQASYGCVLFSGIVKDAERQPALQKLLEAVAKLDYHLTSGEVGLKQVFYALALEGENDTVYRMVTNPTAPSYRHYVDQGLTTLPEYWNYTELWNGLGRSRNHAMMGHVKEWLCRFVMGIRPLTPGYGRVQIKPYLQEEIRQVKGSVFTVRGKIRVECSYHDGQLTMITDIPVGAEADIYLPWKGAGTCYLDGKPFSEIEKTQDGYLRIAGVLSGRYEWSVIR